MDNTDEFDIQYMHSVDNEATQSNGLVASTAQDDLVLQGTRGMHSGDAKI